MMKGGKNERGETELKSLSIEPVVRFDRIETHLVAFDAHRLHSQSDSIAHIGLRFAQ